MFLLELGNIQDRLGSNSEDAISSLFEAELGTVVGTITNTFVDGLYGEML